MKNKTIQKLCSNNFSLSANEDKTRQDEAEQDFWGCLVTGAAFKILFSFLLENKQSELQIDRQKEESISSPEIVVL